MRIPVVALTSTTEVIRDVSRVRVNEAYASALAAAGLLPLVLPPLAPDLAVATLDAVDGLVLTGGEDVDPGHYGATPHDTVTGIHAARDASELALVRAARDGGVPTLAICRGIQVVNVALGGTLVQDIPSHRPGAADHAPQGGRGRRVHHVRLTPGSKLASVMGAEDLSVNSSHHQALDRPGAGLCITARSDDGTAEGAEWDGDDWWMLGVQWHPEELVGTAEPWDRALFEAFAGAVRTRKG